MSKAVQFDDYGGVEVLEVRDVPRPEPEPDDQGGEADRDLQTRIRSSQATAGLPAVLDVAHDHVNLCLGEVPESLDGPVYTPSKGSTPRGRDLGPRHLFVSGFEWSVGRYGHPLSSCVRSDPVLRCKCLRWWLPSAAGWAAPARGRRAMRRWQREPRGRR